MSDITISRPEVVNGHTDVICSTSIRHILAVRKSALLQIDTLIWQLAEISAMTESIGGKTALDWAMKQDFSLRLLADGEPETAMKAITRNLDREIWRDLMQRSGMLSLMDAQARDTWYRSLEYDNFPEISEANILSTFEQLHQNKDEVFERGVINVFRGLSWNYKTNSPCKFGSKNYRQQPGEVGPMGGSSYHRATGRSTCRSGKNAAPVQR
ncbi:putative restriction methylase [Escherichia coli]|nr:putative restriction methylase [Escherichia coli]